MTAAVQPRANLPALTGARGIAAWFVVLYHIRLSAGAQLPPEMIAFFSKGYLAVDFFFMLSGFVIYLNYAERLASHRISAGEFLFRRFARIYPLHLLILLGHASRDFALVERDQHEDQELGKRCEGEGAEGLLVGRADRPLGHDHEGPGQRLADEQRDQPAPPPGDHGCGDHSKVDGGVGRVMPEQRLKRQARGGEQQRRGEADDQLDEQRRNAPGEAFGQSGT